MQDETTREDAAQNAVEPSVKPAEIDGFGDFGTFLMDKAEAYWVGFLRVSPLLIIAAIILALTWALARGVSAIAQAVARRSHARAAIVDLAGVVSKTIVWIIGVFTAMSVVFPSINPGALVSGAGLGAAVIGIAFKDTFENFLAGFLLLLRKAMRIGDYIDCEGVEGKIERTTLRDTYLRRVDGELVIVPNSFLFQNPVRVWTDPDYRRFDLVVGVGYGEDVGQARDVIERAARSLDFGSGKQAQVFASAFGASSVDFNVRWWAEPQPLDMHESRDRMVEAIKSALDEAGIEIPFPYRTLTFPETLKIEGAGGGKED